MPCNVVYPHVRPSPSVTASVMPACLHPAAYPSARNERGNLQEIIVQQPGSPCTQPETSELRLLLIGAILRADTTQLGLLADVMQACGLLQTSGEAEEPEAARGRPRKGT